MKIKKQKQTVETVKFKELELGDVFQFNINGTLCMKCRYQIDDSGYYVRLDNGETFVFDYRDDTLKVIPRPDAVLHAGDDA